ncbi:shikimate dehydrogenase [Nocardioides euryhalodurans]|uniref:Shikimate dehydrogenase n=1 Tax=Nocardioides euryhalodurans TaxID=2518370 RepID=A0A4P7GHN5_9ACTN|nr:shikimate dehydrogenase [Nocardioides euryhalodurans]QBR91375.1 shikimate dehydrogenase [Nocardioides euryhalodurans]
MRCAVVGDPIGHSLSPILHRAAYAAVGLDWAYDAHRVVAGGLAGFVAGLDETWRGLSVTAPLKREALALGDVVTDRARLAGGANTLLRRDGSWTADNTDLPGAAAAVRERWDGPVATVTVLGGGATAASAALAMCDLGATSVRLLVRSAARAAETAAAIGRHPSAPDVEVGDLGDAVVGEVVVSTVPVSAQDAELVSRCAAAPVVFEVLYDPWPTPLAAAAAGRVLVSGLDLLVHQAALQLTLFTGEPAPLAEMRRAGEAALAARGSSA